MTDLLHLNPLLTYETVYSNGTRLSKRLLDWTHLKQELGAVMAQWLQLTMQDSIRPLRPNVSVALRCFHAMFDQVTAAPEGKWGTIALFVDLPPDVFHWVRQNRNLLERFYTIKEPCYNKCGKFRVLGGPLFFCPRCAQRDRVRYAVGCCIALAPLQLPVYVVLWILEWVGEFHFPLTSPWLWADLLERPDTLVRLLARIQGVSDFYRRKTNISNQQ